MDAAMKCPTCNTDLAETRRDGIEMEVCPSCQGMWLTPKELTDLEDEVFDFGDDEKGSLMLGSSQTELKCPQCAKPMKRFGYRLYDLEMDFCDDGHGFWLTAGEDKRVLALMKIDEKNLGRSVLAEERFAGHLRYLQSGGFMDWLNDFANVVMDPKPKPRFEK
jgi:Zn-finger nucleic acid-binding protein